MATTYYRYNPLTRVLTAEPRYIVTIDGRTIVNPSAEQYASLRDAYLKGEDAEPFPEPEGKICVPDGYKLGEDDHKWHRQWTLVDAPAPGVSDYDAVMEEHLRSEREDRGYTTREPDAYLASSVPRWAQDARDWVAHRDAVMGYALGVMEGVKSGAVQRPSLDAFRAGLPAISWTYGEESEDS